MMGFTASTRQCLPRGNVVQHAHPESVAAPRFQVLRIRVAQPVCRKRALRLTCRAHSTAESMKERPELQNVGAVSMATDSNVPEAHKGLHSFLYGEGGAEAHDVVGEYQLREGEDDGTSLVNSEQWCRLRDAEKPIGVYALFDEKKELQYINYSRNVVTAIKGHIKKVGVGKAAYARVKVFQNKTIASRKNLETEMAHWLEAAGELPPGNSTDKELWDEADLVSSMSEAELADYEEKKLRMRKAMGENLFDDVAGETLESKQRRLKLLQAVEGDDWSEVIDEQTQRTVDKDAEKEQIISPFTGSQQSIEEHPVQFKEMTLESVDQALDEVRPYLIADGGNVEVVSVVNGAVALRLQGACGTCPSSTVTMKMGIERRLKEEFGNALTDVYQVDQVDLTGTVTSINAHLDILRPAIVNYGGYVNVVKVENATCHIQYKGPEPIWQGVSSAVKDKFPELEEIRRLEVEDTSEA